MGHAHRCCGLTSQTGVWPSYLPVLLLLPHGAILYNGYSSRGSLVKSRWSLLVAPFAEAMGRRGSLDSSELNSKSRKAGKKGAYV